MGIGRRTRQMTSVVLCCSAWLFARYPVQGDTVIKPQASSTTTMTMTRTMTRTNTIATGSSSPTSTNAGATSTLCDVVLRKVNTSASELQLADCSKQELAMGSNRNVSVANLGLTRVDGFALDATTLDFSNNSLTAFQPDQPVDAVSTLFLSSNKIKSLQDVKIPSLLRVLDVTFNQLSDLNGLGKPSNLTDIYMGGNAFTSLNGLSLPPSLTTLYAYDMPHLEVDQVTWPDQLQRLNLVNISLPKLPANLPKTLTQLDVSYNGFSVLPNVSEMHNLMRFSVSNNQLQTLPRGYKFPENIEILNLADNELDAVEGVYFPLSISYLYLSGNPLKRVVISDRQVYLFKALKVFNGTSMTEDQCKSIQANWISVANNQAYVCTLDDATFKAKYVSASDEASGSGSSGMKWWVIVLIVGACLMLLLIVFLVVRAYNRRKYERKKQQWRTLTMNNPAQNVMSQEGTVNSLFEGNSFSGSSLDTLLLKHRIPSHELYLEKAIAKGGYGIVYVARYLKRYVVVKKILPEKSNDDATLKGFLDEIRLCASLKHPKIVSFLGVTWNTLADVAVVIEFMPNGDLDTLLKRQRERKTMFPDEFKWYESLSPLPPKLNIAVDIAEAIVYLHSFSSPIIHRDLKSRNVLLDEQFGAKLSDFGVSKEWSMDATMTAGIGTLAWIAPEVLRGERYTEKADIYSFGAILTELSTCVKPFENVSNTLLVLKVTTGEERPSMGPDCPSDMRDLANRCLSFSPVDRPSAMALHYELKMLLRLHCSSRQVL